MCKLSGVVKRLKKVFPFPVRPLSVARNAILNPQNLSVAASGPTKAKASATKARERCLLVKLPDVLLLAV